MPESLCQRPATLLKKRLRHSYFPVNFVKFLRTPFFYRTPPVATSVVSVIYWIPWYFVHVLGKLQLSLFNLTKNQLL